MRIEEIVRGFPPTNRIYLSDSYAKRCESRILKAIKEKGSNYYIIPDSSIFHPLGGGQPSDQGWIRGKEFEAEVKKVLESNGVIVLYCKLIKGILGEVAEQELDWERRYTVMRLHTAGHIIDRAVADLIGGAETIGAFHGPPRAYVDYRADIDEGLLPEIERKANELVGKREVIVKEVAPENLEKAIYGAPNLGRLPKAEMYRIVEIKGINAMPCTGTHVRNTSEIGRISIIGIERVGEGTRIYYGVLPQ
jgi:alanyl-tRNA synthetase